MAAAQKLLGSNGRSFPLWYVLTFRVSSFADLGLLEGPRRSTLEA